MKILIRQARPVDAAGGVGNLTDLLIDDGMIAAMGPELEVGDAQVIEAKGLVVSAGIANAIRCPFRCRRRFHRRGLYAQHPTRH